MELCSETKTTINLVFPTKVKLLKHFSDNEHDSDELLKKKLNTYIESHFKITKCHLISTLLTPSVK